MEEFDARRAAMDLVTAFVSNNILTAAELPSLLTQVFNAISGFEAQETGVTEAPVPAAEPAPKPAPEPAQAIAPPQIEAKDPTLVEISMPVSSPSPTPAVSIAESISNPDFIISLITGEKLKTLKRHLRTHGLTEADYRERYSLPGDYPFVASAYSQIRREVAQKMGLGRRSAPGPVAAGAPETSPPTPSLVKAAEPAKGKKAAGKPATTSPDKAKPKQASKAAAPKVKAAAAPKEASAKPVSRKKAAATAEINSSETAVIVSPEIVAMEPKTPATTRKASADTSKPVRAKGAVTRSDKAAPSHKPKAPAKVIAKSTASTEAAAPTDSGQTVAHKQGATQNASIPEKASPKEEAVKTNSDAPALVTKAKQTWRSRLSPKFS